MKTISLIAAMEILKNCVAVIINEEGTCVPFVYEDSQRFLELTWHDGKCFLSCQQKDNAQIRIELCDMFLISPKGKEFKLTILTKKNIEFPLDF